MSSSAPALPSPCLPSTSRHFAATCAACRAGGSRRPSRRGAATPAPCRGCAAMQRRCRPTAATLAPARPARMAAALRWPAGTHAASRCAMTRRPQWCPNTHPRRRQPPLWAQPRVVPAASSVRASSRSCRRRRRQQQKHADCWPAYLARRAATSPPARPAQCPCRSAASAGTPLCPWPAAAQRRLRASSAAAGHWPVATTSARLVATTQRPSRACSAACLARWHAVPASTHARCRATRPLSPAQLVSSPSPAPATAARPR